MRCLPHPVPSPHAGAADLVHRGLLGAVTLPAMPCVPGCVRVLVVAPGATAGWSSWCPLQYLSPNQQGWVHRVTSVLALLPPSWWG